MDKEELDYETIFSGEAVGIHPSDDGYSKLRLENEEFWISRVENSSIETFGASFHVNYAKTLVGHEIGWMKTIGEGIYFIMEDRKRDYFYAPCPPLFPKLNMEMLTKFCHNILLNNKISPKSALKEAVIESVGEELIERHGIVRRSGLNIRRRGSLGCNLVLDVKDGLNLKCDNILVADDFKPDFHLPKLVKYSLVDDWEYELLRSNETFKKKGHLIVLVDSMGEHYGWAGIFHLRADMCVLVSKYEADLPLSVDRDLILASCFLAKEHGYNRINVGRPEDKEQLDRYTTLRFLPVKTVDLTSTPKKKSSTKSKPPSQNTYKGQQEILDW